MKTLTIQRSNVTIDEVAAVLRRELGSRYKVMPSVTSHIHHESSGHSNSILVKRHWLEQANVEVVPGDGETKIHVGGAANFTPTGILINRASIVRKVYQVLDHSAELFNG
jgi:hypothetical protein